MNCISKAGECPCGGCDEDGECYLWRCENPHARSFVATPLAMELKSSFDANWNTDWRRAVGIAALWEPLPMPPQRKTFAIRSALLALVAFAVQWSWLAWWYLT